MNTNQEGPSINGIIGVLVTFINVIILERGFTMDERWYLLLAITLPLFVVTAIDMRRNTPPDQR
ncbi:hypothetical protein [Puia sp.]|jgi:hypothetical protein|uniref:hypothetical protein n=1 Tax=Puia sp. TaxID=2045100 RepID=UPI002F3F8E12